MTILCWTVPNPTLRFAIISIAVGGESDPGEDHGGGLLGGLLGSYSSGSESDSDGGGEAEAAAGVQQQQRVAPTKDAWASDSDEEAGGVRSVLDTL
jgi:hypothetical protein